MIALSTVKRAALAGIVSTSFLAVNADAARIVHQGGSPVQITECSVSLGRSAAKPGFHGYHIKTRVRIRNVSSHSVFLAVVAIFHVNDVGDIVRWDTVSMPDGKRTIASGAAPPPFLDTTDVTTTIDSEDDNSYAAIEGDVCAVVRVLGTNLMWEDESIRRRLAAAQRG